MKQTRALPFRPVTKLLALLGTAAVLLVLGACANGSNADLVVEMYDNRFDQPVYQIDVGDTVEFVNVGRAPHNAIAFDGSWTTETSFGALAMNDGDSTTITFDVPGTYDYFCSFHTVDGIGMTATLIVGGDAAAAPEIELAEEDAITEWTGTTRTVPGDYPTIQSAVDAAVPGDLILVGPGIYEEEVAVSTPYLVIRGTDRNEVIIDGQFQRQNGVSVVADGVAVENLTVRNTTGNGLFWTGVTGYRASYVTSVDAEVYGIYAFDSVDGLFEHSYASGSDDAGYYVGQCDPCYSILSDVIAEHNALGYSGSNASTEMYLLNSVWRYNIAGIAPNSIDGELLPPAHDVVIAGNLIHDNDQTQNRSRNSQYAIQQNGVVIAGANNVLVTRNRIVNHAQNGVLIGPNPDRNIWIPHGNEVRDNVIEGFGRAAITLGGPAGDGHCFEGNDSNLTAPIGLEVFQSCDGFRLPWRWDLTGTTNALGNLSEALTDARPEVPVAQAPKPGPQPQMPGGPDAPVVPAVNVFASYGLDLDSITVPDLPPDLEVDQSKGATVSGIFLQTSGWSIFFGLWAYFLPIMLFGAFVAIAIWDMVRRDDMSRGAMILWMAVSVIVPFLGVIAYFIFGRSEIPAWQRTTIVAGGVLGWLVILAVGFVMGGIV